MSRMIEGNQEARDIALTERVIRASTMVPTVTVDDLGDGLSVVYQGQRELDLPIKRDLIGLSSRFSVQELTVVLERLKRDSKDKDNTLIKYVESELSLAMKSKTPLGNPAFSIIERPESIQLRDTLRSLGFIPGYVKESPHPGWRYDNSGEEYKGYALIKESSVSDFQLNTRFLWINKISTLKYRADWMGDIRIDKKFPNGERLWIIYVYGSKNLQPLVELGQELHIEFNIPMQINLADEAYYKAPVSYNDRHKYID